MTSFLIRLILFSQETLIETPFRLNKLELIDFVMKKTVFVLIVVLSILVLLVAGVMLVDWEGIEEEGRFYTYPLSVGEETYVVIVRSNYSSAPELSYISFHLKLKYYVNVDFRGAPENSFCNITIPRDLLWGEISVIDKYYVMNTDFYTVSNNGTHNSVYFPFNHTALVKHFEIRGTEGISGQST